MASIDLYGADAQRLRGGYRTSLGRDASDDEVTGWMTGRYAAGGTVSDWLKQIDSSHEAQEYRNRTGAVKPPAGVDTSPRTVGQPHPERNTTLDPQPLNPGGVWPSSGPPSLNNTDYAMANARTGLKHTYRLATGREATDAEIDKWLSGGYGYGSGVGDYDKFVTAIMSSPEARAYRPAGTAADGAYQDINWWNQRGVPIIDMFDPMTGQLKPGWKRSAKGYERLDGGTGPSPTTATVPGGNYQGWFMPLTSGKRPSPKVLKEMEPILNQHGIKLGPLNARGFTDGIILPDGTFVDVILSATEDGGSGWGWIVGGHGSGGGAIGSGVNLPGNQYDDEYTRLLEEMTKARIAMLQQPFNDPFRQQYIDAAQRRAQQLGNLAEPEYQRMIKYLEDRFADLKGGGYTGAEHEVLRTQALDPIERDRQAARKRMIERMAAAGHTMESGPMQMALNEVDKAFDEMRAGTQGALATTELQRREGRNQRAEMLAGALHDIPHARANEQLDVFSALEAMESFKRQEEEGRAREAIGYSGMLADLGPQRLQLAMQMAGMGGNFSPLSNTLMQMSQLNQNAAMLNQQNRTSRLNAVGGALYYLSRAGLAGGI